MQRDCGGCERERVGAPIERDGTTLQTELQEFGVGRGWHKDSRWIPLGSSRRREHFLFNPSGSTRGCVDADNRTASSGHTSMPWPTSWLDQRPKLAALTAKYLIVDARPSQSACVVVDHLAHSDPLVERFERWVRSHLSQRFSLEAAAVATGSSKRTLARRLQSVLGKSPRSYFQELRVERAVHLLKTTHDGVDSIATNVGYGDGTTLRNLLRKQLGMGVREIRKPH